MAVVVGVLNIPLPVAALSVGIAALALLMGLTAALPTDASPPEPQVTMIPLSRLEWEHIHQALAETNGNVSAAARLLGMHRRSLQRKLAKQPGPERKPYDALY